MEPFEEKEKWELRRESCNAASVIIGERKTQREISEISRVTEATIRARYKESNKRLLFKKFHYR